MGWFGGSSSDSSGPAEKSFATTDSAHPFEAASPTSMATVGGVSEFQQFSMGLQQQMLVQNVITELSDKAFMKCIQSCKDSKLSGKDVACIQAITNKWLDTNEFMMGRIQKKTEQAAHSQSQFS